MHTSNPSSSSTLTTRTPPFSVAEFRALVSAALDSDAPAPALALSLRTCSSSSPLGFSTSSPFASPLSSSSGCTGAHSLHRKKSSQNLNLAMSLSLSSSSSASHHAYTCSGRMRFGVFLSKLKKRAAALRGLVRRRRASASASFTKATAPVGMPMTSVETETYSDAALFTPYLPLATQYERGTALPFVCAPPSPSDSSHTPSQSHAASASPCSSESSHTPPSPTASSFSARSSLSHHVYSEERPHSDVSLLADDPFAKGAVRVVYRSCEVLPSSYTQLGTGGGGGRMGISGVRPSLRRTGRGRRVSVARSACASSSAVHNDDEESKRVDDSGIYLNADDSHCSLARSSAFHDSHSSTFHETETETERTMEPFTPPRMSTPPPRPSNPTPTSHPSPSLSLLGSLPRSPVSMREAPASKGLTRAPTARTFPLSARSNGKGRKGRPSSPFPLSLGLGRAATTRN
ncbi:hypothetical protein MSAN_00832100 [Mycena sanguinolenta]|uniref:Uncharacterized protein n=1 Tax=Mycena sanguinolenta TaxID=230812 RepID=A0A8H6YZN2_9AGAR|nr:hypothetical protein MSAN_00832100 [Mycena sanguinolenta]